ncbi:hypothetical protein [Largemouth bass virus]|uniref:Uncharacterized protein n=1 Tax=Largemouth bass virus TaxID=176656 RepID=A0A9E7PQ51_9VIRU|nr:hypothetical protein [Largemouth bass virus]WAK75140.1 hypothetical protein [Mandarin fish ranavirus]WEI29028.1 hypothetical protein [Largemouth bass virus]WHA35490.1 hypothetical protein MSRaV_2L [Micropterus salmoides ranavirus]WHA35595.1 hypothetical protein SCRaV_2L [Siniperca chuatsi ranavirus]
MFTQDRLSQHTDIVRCKRKEFFRPDGRETRSRDRSADHRAYASEQIVETGKGIGVMMNKDEPVDFTLGYWLDHFNPPEYQVDNCLQQGLLTMAVMQGDLSMAHRKITPECVKMIAPKTTEYTAGFRLFRLDDREFYLSCNAPLLLFDCFADTIIYNVHTDRVHGEEGSYLGVSVKSKDSAQNWGAMAGADDTEITQSLSQDVRYPRTFPVLEFIDDIAGFVKLFAQKSSTARKILRDLADVGPRDYGWATRPDVLCARYFPKLSEPPSQTGMHEIIVWRPRLRENGPTSE